MQIIMHKHHFSRSPGNLEPYLLSLSLYYIITFLFLPATLRYNSITYFTKVQINHRQAGPGLICLLQGDVEIYLG